MAADTDEELMMRYCSGEASAFDSLYERHKGALYRYVMRMLHDAALVDEVFQDVWLRLIKARERYQERGKFKAWLFQIAHNRIMDHFRQQRTDSEYDDDSVAIDPAPANRHDPVEHVDQVLLARRLLLVLTKLPAPQREVFLLREEAGLSLNEIATVTQTSVEATKSRLRYAVKRLRQGLSDLHP